MGGFLPLEESAVNDSNAQIPVIRRPLGERINSTQRDVRAALPCTTLNPLLGN
jgi:hypothetical protein